MADFSEDFQRSVLRLCMTDEGFAMRAFEHLTPQYFSTFALGWIFRTQLQYFREFSTTVTELSLRQLIRKLPPAEQPLIGAEVETIIRIGHVREAEFIRSSLKEYVQRNVFTEAWGKSQQSYNAGRVEAAFDMMKEAMDRIYSLDFEAPQRTWLMEELSEREKKRQRRKIDPLRGVVPTGVAPLDARIHGGVHPGQVFAVFSYSKIGKTTWLRWQGHRAVLQDIPVLHIILEGSREEAEDGYDTVFSKALYTDIRGGNLSTTEYHKLYNNYLSKRKMLVIRDFADFDVTIDHVVQELTDLSVQGFKPGLLILDYADLMRSRDRGATELKHQTDAVRDLKRLASRRQLPVWTAFQAQRPKSDAHTKAHVLTASSVADAYAKIRIVDAYGSLNATDEEQENNQLRLYWEGHRRARVNRLYKLKVDMSRGELSDQVEEVAPEGAAQPAKPLSKTNAQFTEVSSERSNGARITA